MLRKWIRTGLAVLLASLAGAGVALAHSPVFLPDGAAGVRHTVSDPERSWAIYGRLEPGVAADVIRIEAKQGQALYVQTLVPRGKAGFQPVAVLTGPGLTGDLPADFPAGGPDQVEGGARVLQAPPKTDLYEGFTQMRYRITGQVRSTFPGTGEYRLYLYDPARQGGPYTVAVGEREEFGLVDMLTFPLVWVRAHVWLWKG